MDELQADARQQEEYGEGGEDPPKDEKEKKEEKKDKISHKEWQGYNRQYAHDYFEAYGHPSTKPGAPLQPYNVGDKPLR